MKIWFDPVLPGTYGANENLSGECKEECKECPETSSNTHNEYLSEYEEQCRVYISSLRMDRDKQRAIFHQALSLYKQRLSSTRTLICNPTGLGRVVVVDEEALGLLEQFHTPTSLGSVSQMRFSWPAERIEAAIEVFCKLGLLSTSFNSAQYVAQDAYQTLSAWMHVTNACNLRCDYCYLEKTSEHMAEDTSRRAIDAIFRSALKHRYKAISLRYAGGEASMRIAHILAIHDYALALAQRHTLELHATMLSNGVFLAPSSIEELKARHIGIALSLDGIDSDHDQQRPFLSGRGSFKFVDRTIERLLRQHLIPHITVTVSRRNLGGLPSLMEYILERELPFTLNYYRENGYAKDKKSLQFAEDEMITAMRAAFSAIEGCLPERSLLNSLIDKAGMQSFHQHVCGVARNYLVIDQRGGVAKCHMDIQRTVTTIESEDPLQAIRDDRSGVQTFAADEKEGCRTCDWRYWCNGGCPMLTYQITGRNDIKSPNCNIYKALFPNALRLEALRLLAYKAPVIL